MESELKIGAARIEKITLIVILVAGISLLHYATDKSQYYYHVFYGELYFLPIVLAGLWFGLHGALTASLGITACYAPFVYWHWLGFSPDDFDRILSVLLYNSSAVFIGVLRDREVIANKRLFETERLAAMGKSLAAVAHDMKTPLVAIGGLARRLQKKFKYNDPEREKADIIIRETGRMEKMMHNMLDFSKPIALQFLQGDINEIVEDSIAIVNETARKNAIKVECILSRDLPKVTFDAIRMKQVIENLALNAVEASPGGGIVTIRASDANHEVIIDVTDCGDGISLDL